MFTYDEANQLSTAKLPDGKHKYFEYDAAGRLIEESGSSSSREYSYGWLDKVMNIRHIDGMKGLDETTSFAYHIDGQLAERKVAGGAERATGRPRATPLHSVGGVEKFFWDGLALVKRGETSYINDPSVTGGNPILADNDVLFNDMLGTTLGSVKNGTFNEIGLTSFGANESQTSKPPVAHRFFTGKPYVEDLGAVFLFRNYRPQLGKWQTSDPLGYPDGWNNFAYVNNWVTNCIDWLGWVNVVIVATHQGRLNDNVASDAASYWSYSYEDNSNYRIIEADSVNSAIDQLNDIQNVDNLSLNVHSDGTDMQLTSSMGDMIDSNAFANLTDSVNWTDPSARDVYLCGCDTDSIASSLSENFSGTISGEGTEIGFSNESILGLETIDGNQIDIPRELSTYKEGELISSQTIPIPE